MANPKKRNQQDLFDSKSAAAGHLRKKPVRRGFRKPCDEKSSEPSDTRAAQAQDILGDFLPDQRGKETPATNRTSWQFK